MYNYNTALDRGSKSDMPRYMNATDYFNNC